MSTITEPDAALNFDPQNEADNKIAARLTEIWEKDSASWTMKQKHEFQKLCTSACVTPSTCTASSHKIHRRIQGRKGTEAEYIVLTAIFGTEMIHRLAWAAVFRRREEQYPIDEGVLTTELKKKIRSGPRKGNTASAGSKIEDKDNIPKPRSPGGAPVEYEAKTSRGEDKGLIKHVRKSNGAEGPSSVEQHLVQIKGDIERLTRALGNANNGTGEDGPAVVRVRHQATERPVVPSIETDHFQNNEPSVKQEENLQVNPCHKRKLGHKPNPKAPRRKKMKKNADQELAAASKVTKKAWTTKVLTEKVKDLEARCAAYDEKFKALESLISAKT